MVWRKTTSSLPTNIETPAGSPREKNYRADWTRDPDSSYALTWTNRLGQVVRSGSNSTKSTSSAGTWDYTFQEYEYHPDGRLKRVITLLDRQLGNNNFNEVTQSNTLGQTLSTYTKTSGLTKF